MQNRGLRPLVRPAIALIAAGILGVAACTGLAPATTSPTPGTVASPSAATTAATTGAAGTAGGGASPTATGSTGGAGTTTASPPAGATGEPVTSTASIPTSALPKARFTSNGRTAILPIEVIAEKEYNIGLSGRRSLEGRGMLFAFPDGAKVGFWMKGTHIDLDIAFVDASMQVIDVMTMKADTLDVHTPSGSYVAAVEAPAGWYAANGVGRGATAAFEVDLRAAFSGR